VTRELEARIRFAKTTNQSANRWQVIRSPVPGVWYDFFDVTTGKYGQCMLSADGTWHQEPRGVLPVILAYRAGGRS
jgi:hypothetical protein